jgi:hypothetical protein
MNIYIYKTEEIEHHIIVASNDNEAMELLYSHLLNLWGKEEADRLIKSTTNCQVWSTNESAYLKTYYEEIEIKNV